MCRVTIQRVSAPALITLPEAEVVNAAVAANDHKRPRDESCEEPEDNEHSSDSTMRSGKWTKEEEIYADALIEKFENGTLSDCPPGKTLRSYLSKKLNCIPMRVSKKYGGKCIGKHSYTPVSEFESAEEIARMEKLAQVCWDAVERRLKNRRKRVRRGAPSNHNDSSSDTAESFTHSDNTDQEDLFLDDLLMCDFFSDVAEGNDSDLSVPDDLFDWSSTLLDDDCLLLL